MRHPLAVTTDTLLEQAAHRTAIVNRAVKRWVLTARHNIQRTRDEKPLQVVAVAAGIALVVGALLRVRRANAHK